MSKLPYSVCVYCADQNPHRDRSRGITRYTYGLLSHLRDAKMVRLAALVSKSSFTIPEGIEQHSVPIATDRLVGRLLTDHFHPLIAPRAVADIWHYPKGFLPVGFQVKGKKVGTVADVMLQFDADHHPESRTRFAFAYWLGMLKHSVQTLDLILTVSEFSKQAIFEFCDRHQLKCPPIVVTYEGVDVAKQEGTTSSSREDYVVHLASKLPYKATGWLLEQWSSLGKVTNDLPFLKLVGDLDDRAAALFSKMTNVSLVPPLPRAQLEELISKSRALLLPSEIEGFGIPAIEGYLLGTPVAYSRGTALEEILGGDSPGGFCRDRDSFQIALTDVLNMDPLAIEKKAADLKLRYNWKDCVRRTLEAYSTLLFEAPAHKLLRVPLKKTKVIVAGQIPPPFGGQNIMIEKIVTQFARAERCESVHLPFYFTPDFKSARRGGVGKALELIRVIGRLFRIRLAGPIDLLLYPTGGPQRVPMIRDIFLLPWVLMLSRRVVLHFHAAGIADQLEKTRSGILARLLSFFYRRAFGAVVMTTFNRRDPEAVGIKRILVVPHRVDDEFDSLLVRRGDPELVRLLYLGHLCADKGTPQLLEAFAAVRRNHLELTLDLVGECLPPFNQEILERRLDELQIRPHVRLLGVLSGRPKAEAYGHADLLVFPTVAPYESFGLILAEAMAWRLPIVATRWRGNFDVLTPRAGAICFPVSSSLTQDITNALEQALQQRSQWKEWGLINRSIFEQRYRENETKEWLVEPMLSLIVND